MRSAARYSATRYPFSAAEDVRLREIYRIATRRDALSQQIVALAKELGYPRRVLTTRAFKLGLSRCGRTFNLPLGTVIRQHRDLLWLTQGELAKRLGMRQTNLCVIERGGKYPSLVTLERIARGLETTPWVLLKEAYRLQRERAQAPEERAT